MKTLWLRIMPVFLFFLCMLTKTNILASEKQFSDVNPDMWCYDAISYMSKEGFMSGYPNGTFEPNKNMTRAELAIMLSKIKADYVFTEVELYDVDASSYAAPYIQTAFRKGVLMPLQPGKLYYGPNAPAFRHHVIVAASRLHGYNPDIKGLVKTKAFADYNKIYPASDMHHFENLLHSGAIKGFSDNTLRSMAFITRAEVAQIFYHFSLSDANPNGFVSLNMTDDYSKQIRSFLEYDKLIDKYENMPKKIVEIIPTDNITPIIVRAEMSNDFHAGHPLNSTLTVKTANTPDGTIIKVTPPKYFKAEDIVIYNNTGSTTVDMDQSIIVSYGIKNLSLDLNGTKTDVSFKVFVEDISDLRVDYPRVPMYLKPGERATLHGTITDFYNMDFIKAKSSTFNILSLELVEGNDKYEYNGKKLKVEFEVPADAQKGNHHIGFEYATGTTSILVKVD